MTDSAAAHCLCGLLVVTCTLPTKWVAHCHCSMCRRAHGAGVVTWAGFRAGQVQIPADAPLRWFVSSPGAERGFCTHCGSPMLFRSSRWPDEIHVARALIDGPLDRDPQVHVFHDDHVPWLELGDALPRKGALP